MIEVANVDRQLAVMDVFVTNWNPHEAVRVPLGLINDDKLRAGVEAGTFLLASVNAGAQKSEELYFADFSLAPDPVEI
jgi:hypothetical protein